MNFALLGLTIFVIVLVVGTAFWLIATLGPLHKKQKMRKAEGLRRQAGAEDTQAETPQGAPSEEQTTGQGAALSAGQSAAKKAVQSKNQDDA